MRRPRFTLDQLVTFLQVGELEHVRRAAGALSMSQGAVSEQVRGLERALGIALFERRGRNIRLTGAGKELREAAAAALASARALHELADAYRGLERGELVVTTGNIIGTHRLPQWLGSFAELHPGISVTVRLRNTEAALTELRDRRADCAIAGGEPAGSDLETLEVLRDRLVLVAAAQHPLSGSADPLAELSSHRYLARGAGSGTEPLARRLLGPVQVRTQELEQGALQAGLLAGLGFAAMPMLAVEEHVAAGRLKILPGAGPPVWQSFFAVRLRGLRHPPAAQAFWDHIASDHHNL